jgi:hypothetical protein
MSKFRECEICGAAMDPGEKCDCGMDKYLPAIRCTQPPIIVENIDSVRQNLELLLADISTLPQDDEALKYVKQIRANLAKDFERMEIQRKAAKKQVMEPYDTANEKYQAYVAAPYKEADDRLKKWVDNYQGNLKQKCFDTLKAYFDELCQSQNIDFLSFAHCGVVVDMAMARQKEPRKAMDQIYTYVMGVRSDLDTILKMEDAEEIMAEYRCCPILASAIGKVTRRKADLENTARFLENQRRQREQQSAAQVVMIEAAPEIQPEPEERYSVCFRATGTLSALKAMKAHAQALGVTFEEIELEEENDE